MENRQFIPEQIQRREYSQFVRDFSSRINFDAVVAYNESSFATQEDRRAWFDRFDRSFAQIAYLRACEFDLVRGIRLSPDEIKTRREVLTRFALEMAEHDFLLETPNHHSSKALFSQETIQARDSMQTKVIEILSTTSNQINRYRDLGINFGSSIEVTTNNFVGLSYLFVPDNNLVDFRLREQMFNNGIFSSYFPQGQGFYYDLHISRIGFDPRFVAAIEKYLYDFTLQREIAGEAPTTSEAAMQRQRLIDQRALDHLMQGQEMPPIFTVDPALSMDNMSLIISLRDIHMIMQTMIPPLELEGITEISHRYQSVRGVILPRVRILNILAHYRQIQTQENLQGKALHAAAGKKDYENSVTQTSGTNTNEQKKPHHETPSNALGRRIMRSVINLENELFIENSATPDDIILIRSTFIHTLLHEIGEHMLKNLFTIDDMEAWTKLTANGVIPITRYVLTHMQSNGRPAMEAFCDSVGMLWENAYILQVVAPEYYDFVTNLIERNMPTWRKEPFRKYLDNQIAKSREFWQSQGYTDSQVREEYLAAVTG